MDRNLIRMFDPTGRGEAADAADGRTAAQEDVVEQAARAILAGLKAKDRRDCEEMVRSGITPNRVRPDWQVESWTAARALADAGLLRDGDLTGPHVEIGGQRMTEAQFLAARMPLHNDIEGLEGEVERFKGQRDRARQLAADLEADNARLRDRLRRDLALTDLVDVLKMKLDGWCHAVSPKPMPERAQRIRGREFYSCCLPKGHEGPHRWPESGRNVEWGDR